MHHLGEMHPKLKVSSKGNRRAWGIMTYREIVDEVSRCEVLCSNCHRKRTFPPPEQPLRERNRSEYNWAEEQLGLREVV